MSTRAKISRRELCPICLEQLAAGGYQYRTGQVVRLHSCGHCFHRSCIDSWLQQATTCPTCRVEHPELPIDCIYLGVVSLGRTETPPLGQLSDDVAKYVHTATQSIEYSRECKQMLRLRSSCVEILASPSAVDKASDKSSSPLLLTVRLHNIASFHSLHQAVVLVERAKSHSPKGLLHHILQFDTDIQASHCIDRLHDASTAALKRIRQHSAAESTTATSPRAASRNCTDASTNSKASNTASTSSPIQSSSSQRGAAID
ncbi:uncharacterized protein MONBRDRAFT_11939 [Monosiga brevicollis MX1]|uniref:RING-type domain-containing protein n=1 Tax=Monosiga brevicollis TaxID=81824 RepID=A9VAR1_MONBE|nr:uncharacterized protein MONBRDRAFT_11939 [Monosiga brevicollis MX1]EDQ85365.1 predicted protein [Monosiga brevicollis MX1]|eukprot:XP_001749776.1 hypothetical protein [Monosiga brevicollis MX1]